MLTTNFMMLSICITLFLFLGTHHALQVQYSDKIVSGIRNDLFGASVAANDDVFVVGAPSDYNHHGSITIYNSKANTSDALVKIKSPGGMLFGIAVAVNKDFIVVATQSPSYVYVYSTKAPYTRYKAWWKAGYWTELSSITINDDNTVAVVGNTYADHQAIVYVYKQTGATSWKQDTYMMFMGGADIGEHPTVSLNGNVLAAGIPGSEYVTRRVHVYGDTGSGWKETDSLSAHQDVWYYGGSIKLQQNRLVASARTQDGIKDLVFVYTLDPTSGKWVEEGGIIHPPGGPSMGSKLPAGVSVCKDLVFVSVSDRDTYPDVVAVVYKRVVDDSGNVVWQEYNTLTTRHDPLLSDQYNSVVNCNGDKVLVARTSRHGVGAVYRFNL